MLLILAGAESGNNGESKTPVTHMTGVSYFWLRGQDSNLRPLGYEPNELPLLHPALLTVSQAVSCPNQYLLLNPVKPRIF